MSSNSLYVTTALRDSVYFRSVTDFGVIYYVSFLKDELMLSDESYQFTIVNMNNRKSPCDSKLRRAIMAIVYEFFKRSNTTLSYICETGDSKQSIRNRFFEFWFHSSPRKSDFAFMSMDIRDADGIQNYVAITIRLDNSNLKSIVVELTETIQMLNQKPE